MCKDDYRGARKYLQKAYKLDKTCEKTRISLTTGKIAEIVRDILELIPIMN